MAVPRVYLDQHGWIRLAKAALGRPEFPEHAAAWDIIRHGVASGLISVPLSVVHYMETIRLRNLERRRRLGTIMALVSRFHTIASPGKILEMEVDHAVRDTFRLPFETRDVQVFGVGFEHAFGMEDGAIHYPAELSREQRRMIEDQVNLALLIGWPPDEDAWGRFQVPDQFAAQFAEGEEELADHLASIGWNRGDKLARFLMFDSTRELLDPINDAMRRAGVPKEAADEWDRDRLTALVNRIHTRRVARDLRTIKHPQRQKRWEPNDMQDLAGMSVGVVYCDVVLAERQWADAIRRAQLDEIYGTFVVDSLTELPEAIVTATSVAA
jgi:hypothetical protein